MKIKEVLKEGLFSALGGVVDSGVSGVIKGLGAEPLDKTWSTIADLRKQAKLSQAAKDFKSTQPIQKKRTGGKVAGQLSQTPGAIRKRQARAAKQGGTAAPGTAPAVAQPPTTAANPVVLNVKTSSGAVVTKRKDGKWYDPNNNVITDPKYIQAYEKSPQAMAQRQTQAMAPGRSAAKTAAMAPTKPKGRSVVSYSKPPQKKQGRRR